MPSIEYLDTAQGPKDLYSVIMPSNKDKTSSTNRTYSSRSEAAQRPSKVPYAPFISIALDWNDYFVLNPHCNGGRVMTITTHRNTALTNTLTLDQPDAHTGTPL